MTINTIEYSKLMQKKLDQAVVIGATSGWMEANAGQVIYNGGDELKIPTMTTAGLADYDRDNGFVQGGITVKYNTYKMTQDRGRTFQIDRMDVDESGFVATSANLIKVFQTEHVIPEIDAYRYSTIADIAIKANQSEAITLTADNALTKIREHIRAVQDIVGDDVPLILTMSTKTRALIEDAPKIGKSINVADFKQGGMNFKVKSLDESVIRIAPSSRLKTKYEILDGTTTGQEAGGLKAAADAKDINWIITPQRVPIAISKTDKLRVFEPDTNQKADAWKIDFRKYHDLWIKEADKKIIFVCVGA
ncbi:hypothetical protein [Fenollaria timonensis]|jgi:hypothetical protein|uniref:hypothetical protein n=1 Tax=Fenollaria timonensis TaxID=1723384 RepID=UPI0026F0C0B0|nr:hypothetical protein [Fenollaria timonensis]